MGKIKVYELAKELGIPAKDLVTEINKLGFEVKSHLSVIDDNVVDVVKKNVKPNKKENTEVKDSVKEEKSKKGKNVNPIIIRREIQVVNTDVKEEKKDVSKKEDLGVVKRKNSKDFNIINRNKQKAQVGSIADLFKKNVEIKPEVKNEPVIKKVNTYEILQKQRNTQYENSMQNKQKSKPEGSKPTYNKSNNSNPNTHTTNNTTRPQTGAKQGYNKPSGYNKPKKVEDNIKSVISQSFDTEPHKDFNRGVKKVAVANDDNKKVNNRFNKYKTEEIDKDKIRDLKSHDSLSRMFNDSEGGMLDYYDISNNRRNKKGNKKNRNFDKRKFEKNKIFELTNIKIPETISVKDLAEAMKKTSAEVIKKLFGLGIMATINQEIDFDTAFLIAQEFNITAEKVVEISDEEILFDDSEDKDEDLVPRAPIVVVMGHVDHGKTSLLDAIRSTNVSEKEAGGITQHIGAYQVQINNRDITFLDTPGHEAFTSLRARGAQVTDIAILVVAADDGIMPQTIEAINHAKAANVPIIVAINKMDKEGANVQRIKESLMEYELVPEEWGGSTICVPISAKKHEGIDELLEMVLLVADMQNLRANPNKQAKGTVIESRLDKSKGVITSLIVQRGTLDTGDTLVLGNNIGKVRSMTDDKGKIIKKAGPSMVVEITGMPEVSIGGELFYEVENEKVAKHLIESRRIKQRERELKTNNIVTVEDLFNKIESNSIKDLNIIVKSDVQGSLDALKSSLLKLSNDEVKVNIIHSNVGDITMSDVTLAKVANAKIVGFNVKIDADTKNMVSTEKVELKLYNVIYDAINDIKLATKGMLEPVYEEEITGTAEVRNTFKVSNVGTIAGCYVLDGKIMRNGMVRIIREEKVIYTGKISSLKRFKDDVKEALAGYECGIQIEDFNDIIELDKIECYIMKEVKNED